MIGLTPRARVIFTLAVLLASPVWSDESESTLEEKATETVESARETMDIARDTLTAAADAVEQSEEAQQVTAGILQPIYWLAEAFSFSAFHWLAFTLMVAGVVSFALQLTLGKLVVLAKLGFSLVSVLSDVMGLSVSLVGLVLTTQAAAENSNFTQSALAVLSSTAVGILLGLLFYFWGQRQELQALEGRRAQAAAAE